MHSRGFRRRRACGWLRNLSGGPGWCGPIYDAPHALRLIHNGFLQPFFGTDTDAPGLSSSKALFRADWNPLRLEFLHYRLEEKVGTVHTSPRDPLFPINPRLYGLRDVLWTPRSDKLHSRCALIRHITVKHPSGEKVKNSLAFGWPAV